MEPITWVFCQIDVQEFHLSKYRRRLAMSTHGAIYQVEVGYWLEA